MNVDQTGTAEGAIERSSQRANDGTTESHSKV